MIHFDLLRDRGILIVTPQGPLEKTDFDLVAQESTHTLRKRESSTA